MERCAPRAHYDRSPFLAPPSSLVGPLTSPTYYAILASCVFIPWLIFAAVTNTLKRTFPPIILAMAGIGLVVLFTKSQFAGDIRLNNLIADEKRWWPNELILSQFIQSFSLFYPFLIVLLFLVPFGWKKWSDSLKRSFTLSFTWAVFPVGLIFLSVLPWIPLVNGRIGMDISTVPVGILCAHIFYAAKQLTFPRRILKSFVNGLFVIMLAVSIILSIVYFRQMIQKQDHEVYNEGYSWTLYPTVNVWNSMMELKKVPLWSHIMINPRVGDVLPAFVPVIVYQGNPYAELDWIPRRQLSYEFYRGDMPVVRRNWLLKINAISYVYYGTEEKTSTVTPTFYPEILTPIYANPEVTIYKVQTSAL
jgi:hypothetical protein